MPKGPNRKRLWQNVEVSKANDIAQSIWFFPIGRTSLQYYHLWTQRRPLRILF